MDISQGKGCRVRPPNAILQLQEQVLRACQKCFYYITTLVRTLWPRPILYKSHLPPRYMTQFAEEKSAL